MIRVGPAPDLLVHGIRHATRRYLLRHRGGEQHGADKLNPWAPRERAKRARWAPCRGHQCRDGRLATVGVRDFDMPATSDRVWQAIQAVSVPADMARPGALAVEPGAVPRLGIGSSTRASLNTGSGTRRRAPRHRLPLGRRRCGFGDGRYLLWSDIPNNRIMKWEEETGRVSIFRKPSNCKATRAIVRGGSSPASTTARPRSRAPSTTATIRWCWTASRASR